MATKKTPLVKRQEMLSEFHSVHELVCAFIEAKHKITEDDLTVSVLENIIEIDHFLETEISIENAKW